MNHRLRRGLKRALRGAGLDVRRDAPCRSYDAQRRQLLEALAIELVLDVGANAGGYGLDLRSGGYHGRIASFEPLREPFAALMRNSRRDVSWSCHRLALADRDGRETMNVAGNYAASSSFLSMNEKHRRAAPQAAYVGTEEVELARLDSVADSVVGDSDRVFAKLDVQGFEPNVLDGATDTLARIQGLEVELSFTELYEGQPPFREMLDRLESAGFTLAGIQPELCDPDGRLLQADSLWRRF